MSTSPLRRNFVDPAQKRLQLNPCSAKSMVKSNRMYTTIKLPDVPSPLELIETAEPHVAIVPITSSSIHSVQNKQVGPSHGLQIVAATSIESYVNSHIGFDPDYECH